MQHSAHQTILQKAIDIIRQASSGSPYHNQAALARATGESEANISRWLNGTSTPTLKKLEPLLTSLGVRLRLPDEEVTSPVLLVNEEHQASDASSINEAFKAVPMKGDVGSGDGMGSQEQNPLEWFVVPQCDGVNMWAMRVASFERSMMPTIHPGDIVLIDRTPVVVPQPKHIYLVQPPPQEGNGYLLKRVKITQIRKKTVLIFYSDNTAEGHTPVLYELKQYPESSLQSALKGVVAKVWSDLHSR